MQIYILQANKNPITDWASWETVGVFDSFEKMLESLGLPSINHPIVYKHQLFREWWYLDLNNPKQLTARRGQYYSLQSPAFKYQIKELNSFSGEKIAIS